MSAVDPGVPGPELEPREFLVGPDHLDGVDHAGHVHAVDDDRFRFDRLLQQVLLGMAEEIVAAYRDQRLAALSDAELARLGITRKDVPWFALYGKRRLC